jgi:hypothetical protein
LRRLTNTPDPAPVSTTPISASGPVWVNGVFFGGITVVVVVFVVVLELTLELVELLELLTVGVVTFPVTVEPPAERRIDWKTLCVVDPSARTP